ncbi:MAG: single-stranded DNA-binding protein [Clostridiales bacterium]|jgi:single-strand DNA-binding protein|nr:single-stranded DNA-binding protein [Clostridiales bacterium]
MNKVILIGNLTRDPELSQTTGGIPYCRMSIAVNRNYLSADGERLTDFFNIVTWRGLAENCHKYLRKGSKIGVCGTLQTRSYEQDGIKRYITEIVAEEVEFLTPKSAQDSYEEKKSIQNIPPIEDDDLPF